MLTPRFVTLTFDSVDAARIATDRRPRPFPGNVQPCAVRFGSIADAARALGVTRAAIHNAKHAGYRVRGATVKMGGLNK